MMNFTFVNKQPVSLPPPKLTKTNVVQNTNTTVAIFQNMLQGKYRCKGCSSCSGAR